MSENIVITPEMIEERRRARNREYLKEWRKRYKEEHGVSYSRVYEIRRAERELLQELKQAETEQEQ